MANSNNGNNEKKEEENIDWLKVIGIGVGAAALIGGGIYAIVNHNNQSTPSPPPSTSRSISPSNPNTSRSSKCSNDHTIIAVDTTPRKGGGLLILNRESVVFYYSVKWPNTVRFPDQSDKFEMINALVALKVFHKYFAGDVIRMKIDNTFYQANYKKDHGDQLLLQYIKGLTETYNVEVCKAYADSDHDMWNANQLSRNGSDCPKPKGYPAYYSLQDISSEVEDTMVEVVEMLPPKYLKHGLTFQ